VVQVERAVLARARARLEAGAAAVTKAVAIAELARATLDRSTRLHAQGVIARQEFDVHAADTQVAEAAVLTAKAELLALDADVQRAGIAIEIAEGAAASARAALAVSESRLRDAFVAAPFTGLIVARHVEPGAVVVPGSSLFTLVDPSTLWAAINLDERLLGELRVGQHAEIVVRSSPGRIFPGSVVRIREVSDRVAEELAVDIGFLEAPPRLRIGEQAEATVLTSSPATERGR
jgi:HlyD family secretion protein